MTSGVHMSGNEHKAGGYDAPLQASWTEVEALTVSWAQERAQDTRFQGEPKGCLCCPSGRSPGAGTRGAPG